METRDERTGPEVRPCFDCGVPAVADCCRCERPVCLVHVNKRWMRNYRGAREPYLVRFHCDQCLDRYFKYAWLIGVVCIIATVVLVWVSVLSQW